MKHILESLKKNSKKFDQSLTANRRKSYNGEDSEITRLKTASKREQARKNASYHAVMDKYAQKWE